MGPWTSIIKYLAPIFSFLFKNIPIALKYSSSLIMTAVTGLLSYVKQLGYLRVFTYITVFGFMKTSLYAFVTTGNILPVISDLGTKLVTAEHNIILYVSDLGTATGLWQKSVLLLSIFGSYLLFIYSVNVIAKLQSLGASNTSYRGFLPLMMAVVILFLIELVILISVAAMAGESINFLENVNVQPFRGLIAPMTLIDDMSWLSSGDISNNISSVNNLLNNTDTIIP